MASEQTRQIIDEAFKAHVSEAFGRLASATEPDAVNRFVASWNRAIVFRDKVLTEVNGK